MQSNRTVGEWSRGWPMVAAGLTGMFLMSLHTGPVAVLIKPLNDMFGWQRAQLSSGLLILSVVQLLLLPKVGLLLSRFGAKKIVLTGAIVFSVGLYSLAFSKTIWHWYRSWLIIGAGITCLSPLIWTTLISRAFDKQRGLALAIGLSGTGVATFATPLVCAYAFEIYGWQAPFFVMTGLGLFVVLPLLYWLMSLRPDFSNQTPTTAEEVAQGRPRLVEALCDIHVWELMVAGALIAGAVGMIITHLQPIMRDAGATPMQAAAYFTIVGPSLFIGRLMSGILLDRLPMRLVVTVLFLIPGMTCLMLLTYGGSVLWGIIICVFFGLGYGAETEVLAYLTSRYFSQRLYPVVYSLVYGVFGVSYGAAAVLGGAAFDAFESYDKALYLLFSGVILAIVLILTLDSQRNRHRAILLNSLPEQLSSETQ